MGKICFLDSHKRKLCGILSDSEGDSAVLMFHGLGRDKYDMQFGVLEKKLNALGIATFRVDMLGHGESEGEFDDLTLSEAIDDILCAKHELERRGYKKIGLIGTSFGGVGGIMAASAEKFWFLVLISPPTYYNVNDVFTSGIYMLRELNKTNKSTQKKKSHPRMKFFKDYGSHDSYAAAEKIRAPVLVIHGDKDKIVPIAKIIELVKRIDDCKIKLFRGVGHSYANTQTKVSEEIIRFVKGLR